MKTLALTSAIVLGLTAPSLANDQFAQSIGVEPGTYSFAELLVLNDAQENEDRQFLNFALNGSRNSDGPNATALEIARIQAEEDDEGNVGRFLRSSGNEVISTQSFVGDTDAARAQAIQWAEENDDRQLLNFLRNGGSLRPVGSLF
ncbi:MAG: hypothetical protein AAGF88_00650 [Pseudomonadota bacterium]